MQCFQILTTIKAYDGHLRYVHTPKNTASARWGVIFAATVHEPPPLPRLAQKCPIRFVDPSAACLSAQSAGPLRPAVTAFQLVSTVLWSQPIAVLG